MKGLTLVSFISLLVCPHGAVEVCLPYKLSSLFVRFETSDYGVLALDFVNNMVAKHTISQNVRTVFNLTQHTAYDIDLTTGQCVKHPMAVGEVYGRCLPSSARQYSPNNSYIGLAKYSLDMQAFEVDLPDGGLARVALTVSYPAIPLASQLTGFSYKGIESYYSFNSVLVVDPILFVIPSTCL